MTNVLVALSNIPSISHVPVCGRRILLRVDLNVPTVIKWRDDGTIGEEIIMDDTRIRKAAATIRQLLKRGARVIVLGHRDSGARNKYGWSSLKLVANQLSMLVKEQVGFETELASASERVLHMHNGQYLILENVRKWPGEIANDLSFAQDLARLGEIYVNDAVATCHRTHTSIVGLPGLLPAYAGPNILREISFIMRVLGTSGKRVAIIGGRKLSKLQCLPNIVERFDNVLVGGALADVLLNRPTKVDCDIANAIECAACITRARQVVDSGQVLLPDDLLVVSRTNLKPSVVSSTTQRDKRSIDIGPQTVRAFRERLKNTDVAVWFGPLGCYEDGHLKGSQAVASELSAQAHFSGAGGGDTLACLRKMRMLGRFDHLTTAGGAALALLADENVPGIKALLPTRLSES